MGFNSRHSAIRGRFAAQWDVTPVAWPNTPYTPVDGVDYVRFYIADGDSSQQTIGDPAGLNKYRSIGLIVAQIYTAINMGDGDALAYADSIAAIFRNQRFSGVWSLTPKITTVGNSADGRYQINVTIPFQRDEVL